MVKGDKIWLDGFAPGWDCTRARRSVGGLLPKFDTKLVFESANLSQLIAFLAHSFPYIVQTFMLTILTMQVNIHIDSICIGILLDVQWLCYPLPYNN